MATHRHTSGQGLFAYRRSTHLGLILFVFALLFLKNAPLFLAGQFVSEDSFYFYETAYNADWLTALTTPYAGYLNVLPMLLAELLWHVPFALLPWVNHLVALALCVLLLSWLYTPYCRGLIASDGARAACVILMALTPYQPNLGMLLGLHWYLTFTVGLILLGDLPRQLPALAALSVLVVLSAWSAPATVVLIPVAVLRWWQLRKDRRRYLPLSFAAAGIAYAMAIHFVFKPGSSQPGFAELGTAIQAGWIMLTQGLLLDSVFGIGLAESLPAYAATAVQIALALGILTCVWRGRAARQTWLGVLLIVIGCTILELTMLRGFQSALIVKTGEPVAARYLATPGFYLWAGLFAIVAPLVQSRFKAPALIGMAVLAGLLLWAAPPLSGTRPLSEAFPHAPKAQLLATYEARVAAGAQPETLALPGWAPIECMRLQIGGGRECPQGEDLECIFGSDLQKLGGRRYRVAWLGELESIKGPWYRHNTLGVIAPISYQKGFYWFQDASGQRYLSGPAIYPRMLEYPPKNMLWTGNL